MPASRSHVDGYDQMNRRWWLALPVAAALKAHADRDGLLAVAGLLFELHRNPDGEGASVEPRFESEAGIVVLMRCSAGRLARGEGNCIVIHRDAQSGWATGGLGE